MSELNRIFSDLRENYVPGLQWVDVEEWLYGEIASPDEGNERGREFWSLPIWSRQEQMQQQLQTLRELAGVIRSLRDDEGSISTNSYSNTHDNWSNIISFSPASAYLAYIYTVVSLSIPPAHILEAAPDVLNQNLNLQLSLNAASTYLLTLTIPGAKRYAIFDEDVIEQVLKLFVLLEQNADRSVFADTIWMHFLTMCDDLKLVFRYVHFKEHVKIRDKIIRCLLQILYMNFQKGYQNSRAPALHAKCYELFGEITNEHNGDVYDTLHLIMRQSFPMHIFTDSPQNIGSGRRAGPMQTGEHISDWFIQLIDKYPDILAQILHVYIKCVVSNPLKAWKASDEKIAIGYAAKYDRILYAKCNKSCADFLLEAVKADDAVGIQTRALDLIERFLLQQTEVEWSIFRHEVSKVPREVRLLQEVIRCLNDRTFSVRRKACQVLISALKQGSPRTTKILQESIRFVQFDATDVETLAEPSAEQHELRFEKPAIVQGAYSFEGYEQLEAEVKNLPKIVYERFLDADNGLARTSGIALLERLVLVNPLIIYNTNFVRETSLLAVDGLASVRKAALELMQTLLEAYSNCFALICVYCRIWACLLGDEDVALQKLAIQSFDKIVLKNIQPMEYSNEPKHFMPWRIVNTLMMTQPRAYLQERFAMLLERETIVTTKLVNIIISHLSTSTDTDAWALLLLLSSRITNNMDALIVIFNGLSSYNMKANQVLALQLIICCLSNFSKPALNQLFQRLLEALRTGNIWLGLISSAVNLINQIHHLSDSQGPSADSDAPPNWQLTLLDDLTEGILESANNFQHEHTRLQCLLGAYTEILVMLPQTVDTRIKEIVFKYLRECTKLKESGFDTDNERMTNWMIVIAGRLCLREHRLASEVSELYQTILTKNDRPQIINTTLIAINDLGKKHPNILERNFQCILAKMHSKYAMTRVRTFRCVKDVILSGIIKLKGPILISMLAALVDDSAEVAREADAFFIRYKRLYDKTVFVHCLRESPFYLNGQPYLKGVDPINKRYQSPLKGAKMVKSRRLLYNHIMSTIDEHTLLLYFGQLKLLAEKSKDEAFVSAPGALAVVQDILFIMRRICYLTKGKGRQQGARPDGENSDEGEQESEAPAPAPNPSTSSAGAAAGAPPARGRGRQRVDLDEPLKQLERCLRYVEETYSNLQSVMSPELQHSFDNLCQALAMRFPSYIDFAQPAKFWQKYRSSKPTKTRAKQRRRRAADDEAEADTEEEDDAAEAEGESDSDNELPLERHRDTPATGSSRAQRRNSCDNLVTELIFQPPDW
ncbi:uncharacterized protein Cap-D3 [Drosophila pseudoobscura]|uniref:Uncharacterized protein Cap-D3 n=1 Tax=Drosophila pseudoobscura pseudoobscura TaxID=46245 RepID=A0A6I8ULU9_DROPS|nr:uncharacterized protein LOC4817819 [Drosophila pseudoobscura]